MKKLIPIVLLLLLACDTVTSDLNPNSVYIRIVNSSPIDFKSAYIRFPKSEHTFGVFESGRSSRYQKFEEAYRYGYIEVKTERETYVLQPIDYVGESPLNNGKYTFKLNVEDDQLTLETIKD